MRIQSGKFKADKAKQKEDINESVPESLHPDLTPELQKELREKNKAYLKKKRKFGKNLFKENTSIQESSPPDLTPELQKDLKGKNKAYLKNKRKLSKNIFKDKVLGDNQVSSSIAGLGAAKLLGSLGKGATACKAAVAASPAGITIGLAAIVIGGLIYLFT